MAEKAKQDVVREWVCDIYLLTCNEGELEYKKSVSFFKRSFSTIRFSQSVCPSVRDSKVFFVDNTMSKLSYQFQTWYADY